MKLIPKLILVLFIPCQAYTQFAGEFDPANWTFSTTNGGFVHTFNAPATINILGLNSMNDTLNYSIPVTSSMGCPGTTLSFDWETFHPDCSYDSLFYGVNGTYTFISSCAGTGSCGPIELNPGDVFSFQIRSHWMHWSIPTFVISNFAHMDSDTLFVNGVITPTLMGPDGAIDITVTGGAAPYTFDWSNGDVSEDLTGLVNGSYTVTATDSNGCIKTETFVVGSQLGTDEAKKDVGIFPNPVANLVTIQCMPGINVSLFNSAGSLVYSVRSEGVVIIDVSNFSEGFYTVQFDDDSETARSLLIKH